ncbi:hypothetical protein Tco_0571280 [Tanacetum coccineum]
MTLKTMTRNAGRGGTTLRGGRTGERRVRGGGRSVGNDGDNGGNPDTSAMIAQQLQALLPTIVTQINISVINQGNRNGGGGDDNSNGGNDNGGNEHGNHRNGNKNYNGNGCMYKEFLACKPKDFNGKGGALVYTRWVEKMELVIDISNYATNQRVKYATCSFSGRH